MHNGLVDTFDGQLLLQASELEQWGIARHALESGLRCSPQHYVLQNKLLEVLLQLADWQSIPSVLEHILKQNPGNVRAVKVFSAISSHQQPIHPKRPASSQIDASEADNELAQLQPQLKRRQVAFTDNFAKQPPIQHDVTPSSLSWRGLAKTLADASKAAAKKGLPGGCKVVISLPNALKVVSDTSVVASPPAASGLPDQPEAGSLVLDLSESDDAAAAEASQQAQHGEVQDASTKASAVPAIVPQRASQRLGSSRYTGRYCMRCLDLWPDI